MTKQEFQDRVLRHLPPGDKQLWIEVFPPYEWYLKTWTMSARAAVPCFPCGARHDGRTKFYELDGARSKDVANAKAAKYRRWAAEAASKDAQ